MLTEQQEQFCKNIALFEMQPYEAYLSAGYPKAKDINHHKYDGVTRLLNNKAICDEIDRLRNKYLDIESLKRDIILEHQKTRDLDITSVMHSVAYTDENGIRRFRVEVKPVSEWTVEQRKAVVGFDKNGLPIFKNKEKATQELSRLFGLYKDNTVVVEQDLDSIYDDALGIENNDVVVNTDPMQDLKVEMMNDLDKELMGIEDDETTKQEVVEVSDEKVEKAIKKPKTESKKKDVDKKSDDDKINALRGLLGV